MCSYFLACVVWHRGTARGWEWDGIGMGKGQKRDLVGTGRGRGTCCPYPVPLHHYLGYYFQNIHSVIFLLESNS
jgi:hypothetical protein